MSSVMDYPFPNMPLDLHGVPICVPRLSTGCGRRWDSAAIYYGYHPFPADEQRRDPRALIVAETGRWGSIG